MLPLNIILLLAFFLFFLILKVYRVSQTPTGFDSFGHMYFAQEIQKQRSGPFGGIDLRVQGSKKFYNVLFLNWLFSKLPEPIKAHYANFLNLFLDTLFAIALIPLAVLAGYTWQSGLLACLLYYTSPIWFSAFSLGPRVLTFTPRLISELATNLFFFVTVIDLGLPTWVTLLVAGFIASFVLLSSKFSTQAIVFITVPIALIGQQWITPVALVLGIVLSLIATKGMYLSSLNTQITHLRWFFTKNANGEMNVSSRNNANWLFLYWDKDKTLISNIKKATMSFASRNGYTCVLFKLPLLFVLSIMLTATAIVAPENVNITLLVPVVSAFIIYLLTNLKRLLFLGESERYLSHVALFIVMLFVDLAVSVNMTPIVYLVMLYGLLFVLYEVKYADELLGIDRAEITDSDAIIDFLNAIDETKNIVLYPYHAAGGTWRVLFETHHNVIFNANLDDTHAELFKRKFELDYPFVSLAHLEEMHTVMGANLLILDNRYKPVWEVPAGWHPVPISKTTFTVYRHEVVGEQRNNETAH